MMQKWLFVIKISVFNVFSYIFSIMILSIFMNMQIILICKLDNLHQLSLGERPGHKIKHDTMFSELG